MHERVLTLFMENLEDSELAACLCTILHLIKLSYIIKIDSAVIDKITQVTINNESSNQVVIPGLAVLCQMLFLKNPDIQSLKQKVRRSSIML